MLIYFFRNNLKQRRCYEIEPNNNIGPDGINLIRDKPKAPGRLFLNCKNVNIMQRHEAREIAETVSINDLKQMFINAQNVIKNWEAISRVNKGLTKGSAFNILSKCEITDKTPVISKTNMVMEFGEWLPNYKKAIKPNKINHKPTHQEPKGLPVDFFDAIFDQPDLINESEKS